MPWDDEVHADPDVALDSSERAGLDQCADIRDVSSNPEDLIYRTGPVDRRDPPADLTGGITTDSVPERAIVAARGHFIERCHGLRSLTGWWGSGSSIQDTHWKAERPGNQLRQVCPNHFAIADS